MTFEPANSGSGRGSSDRQPEDVWYVPPVGTNEGKKIPEGAN